MVVLCLVWSMAAMAGAKDAGSLGSMIPVTDTNVVNGLSPYNWVWKAAYMSRTVCPNKHPADSRYQHILNMVEEFDVQGVLIIHQKFCDPHEFDIPHIEAMFKGHRIPTAFIEIETTFSLNLFDVLKLLAC